MQYIVILLKNNKKALLTIQDFCLDLLENYKDKTKNIDDSLFLQDALNLFLENNKENTWCPGEGKKIILSKDSNNYFIANSYELLKNIGMGFTTRFIWEMIERSSN